MNTPSVKTLAELAILIGSVLFFLLEKRRYNRAVGITPARQPLPFIWALLIAVMERLIAFLCWLLILFGLFFLLLVWYNNR